MQKKLLIVVVVVAVLGGLVYFINTGEKMAVNKARQENPIFHTISEGGACVEGRGDCQGGLTCVAEKCQKP